MFTLTGAILSDHQTCPRRTLLNHDWQTVRYRPKALFDACLRMGVFDLSAGKELQATIDKSVTYFLQCAANPGLDIIGDPFLAAKDWTMMLEMILRSLSRIVLLTLQDIPVVQLDSTTVWKPLALRDESGTLHRWITLSSWDEDALARELHGWYSFGDIAVTRCPMTLHVIVIGSIRNGRRASTWARGWKHPTINTLRVRFRQATGSPFRGWRPVYLADISEQDTEAWARQMWDEGAAQALTRHIQINAPSDVACEDTLRQILMEAKRIRTSITEGTPFHVLPMSRAACDGLIPCVWQHACYSEKPVTDLSTLGLYVRRPG